MPADATANAPGAKTDRPGFVSRLFDPEGSVLPLVPVVLRALQLVLALIAFSIVASAESSAFCLSSPMTTDTDDADAASSPPAGTGTCFSSKSYQSFSSTEYLLVIGVVSFLWAIFFLAVDVTGVGRDPGTTMHSVVPRVAFWGDTILTFLALTSGAAAAGFVDSLDSLHGGMCGGLGDFCGKVVASVVFIFLTAATLGASTYLNTANESGPW